jgi:hypothetical protein
VLWCFSVSFGQFKAFKRVLKTFRPIRLYQCTTLFLSLLEAVLKHFELFRKVLSHWLAFRSVSGRYGQLYAILFFFGPFCSASSCFKGF